MEESLQTFCNIVYKPLGIFPSQAWVSNGLAIAVLADFLIAWFNIAFNHNTFYHVFDFLGVAAAVKDFFYYPDLFQILFA